MYLYQLNLCMNRFESAVTFTISKRNAILHTSDFIYTKITYKNI